MFSTERQQEGQENHGPGRGHGDTGIGEHEPDAEPGGGGEESIVQVGIGEELGEPTPPLVDQAPGAAARVDAGEVEEVAEEDEDRDDRERGDDRQGRVDLDDVEVRAELAADHLQGLTGDDLVEERAEVRACPGRAQPVEEGDADEDRQRSQTDEGEAQQSQSDLRQQRHQDHEAGQDGDRTAELRTPGRVPGDEHGGQTDDERHDDHGFSPAARPQPRHHDA